MSTQAPLQFESPFRHSQPVAPHCWLAVQTVPQAPQFEVSVARLTQAPLHAAKPEGQAHCPATQICVDPQAMLQPPQLAGSADASVQPIPQSICPVGQAVGKRLPLLLSEQPDPKVKRTSALKNEKRTG